MYTIDFYQTSSGECNVLDFLESLRKKSSTNKDARVQYKQIAYYIELLEYNGTWMPENITKHLDEDIWELRPGNNRVFYFFFRDDTFVLLHHYRKKSQKTPKKEIERAKSERDDYIRQKGEKT
ncbi:MAG: type II toxin-antitoxin system RelE/ParE family toxin [Eubacterium sp.]|nr:type II toxin-antitoxin system RelE/ParE family toxin [Eubacterium sp.]